MDGGHVSGSSRANGFASGDLSREGMTPANAPLAEMSDVLATQSPESSMSPGLALVGPSPERVGTRASVRATEDEESVTGEPSDVDRGTPELLMPERLDSPNHPASVEAFPGDRGDIDTIAVAPAAFAPVVVEPAVVEPVAFAPIAVDSGVVESAAVESAAVEPAAFELSEVEPVAVESAAAAVGADAVVSAVVESGAVESNAAEPVAFELSEVEPAAVEPAAVNSRVTEPAVVESSDFEPVAVAPVTVESEAFESEAVESEAFEPDVFESELFEAEAFGPITGESCTVEVREPSGLEVGESISEAVPDIASTAGVDRDVATHDVDWLEKLDREPSLATESGTHRITVRALPSRSTETATDLQSEFPSTPVLIPTVTPTISHSDGPTVSPANTVLLEEAFNPPTGEMPSGAPRAHSDMAPAIVDGSLADSPSVGPADLPSGDSCDLPSRVSSERPTDWPSELTSDATSVPIGAQGPSTALEAPEVQSWNHPAESTTSREIAVRSLDATSGVRIPPPRVLSLRIPRPTVKVSGFTFPEAPWAAVWMNPPAAARDNAAASANDEPATDSDAASATETADVAGQEGDKPGKLTRIKPPGDVIKLEDRLYYVLQPPLESLVACGEIHMPFEPFPYQYEGIGFLYPRYTAVLADEMGLGKTMQAIMTIRLLLRAGEVRNVLLVCPKPLVSNWRREFQTWAPEIPVGIIEGDQARRHWQWRQASTPVKIANYELLMRDRDVLDANLHFDLVALDEAQRIKNKSSTTSEIVRSITRTRSWALTGTPVENSPEDLVGIFEFLSPGYLTNDMQPRRMGELVKDHILRRTKDMVLTDMPPKLFRDATLDLTPEQHETYRRAEDDGVMKLTDMGPGITIQHVFELVLRLKQICNFDPVTGASSKLERLEADLEEVVASGQKAILFTQWVVTIARLREKLARFGTLEYHGQLPHKQRETVIDQFKNDPSKRLIMMSYGAGSVGLNLQFCRYVFLFDRWWNPAIEDQAINRAHRIGVSGPVTVTRMITGGTIEERINQVLDEKRELFNSILSHADNSARGGLTQNEIFGLFNLKVQPKPKAA